MKVTPLPHDHDSLSFSLNGAIDEKSEIQFQDLLRSVGSGKVSHIHLDLKEVSSINSLGAKYWIRFLEKSLAQTKVTLANCPPVFIDYCNLLDGFCTGAEVLSILIPMQCENCGHCEQTLANASELVTVSQFESTKCPRCQSAFAAEVDAEEYLFFLQQKP